MVDSVKLRAILLLVYCLVIMFPTGLLLALCSQGAVPWSAWIYFSFFAGAGLLLCFLLWSRCYYRRAPDPDRRVLEVRDRSGTEGPCQRTDSFLYMGSKPPTSSILPALYSIDEEKPPSYYEVLLNDLPPSYSEFMQQNKETLVVLQTCEVFGVQAVTTTVK